jgi:hypothetical protein
MFFMSTEKNDTNLTSKNNNKFWLQKHNKYYVVTILWHLHKFVVAFYTCCTNKYLLWRVTDFSSHEIDFCQYAKKSIFTTNSKHHKIDLKP